MSDDNGDFLHTFFAYLHFKEDKQAVVNSPDYVVPACTVPDTCTKPYKEESAVFSALAENGDIEYIIAEEGAERYMPSLPEFSNILADKGVFEVFVKVEAEHSAKTDSNIGIS